MQSETLKLTTEQQARFNEDGFQLKMSAIKGFILSDIVGFPIVDIFVVPIANVLRWLCHRLLGANAKVSRAKFLSNLAPDIQF